MFVKNRLKKGQQGFVLIDVLMALFLFATGFAALYGLTEGAIQNSQEALTRTEAANLAQNRMEELSSHSWTENLAAGRCVPGGEVKGLEKGFQWSIRSEWERENVLLEVTSEVTWLNKGKTTRYALTTLFYTQ